MLWQGNIISGEFDEAMNEFSLQQVKHFAVASTIKEKQLHILADFLREHQNDKDGQIITLYDQMPVRLSQEEIALLIRDFEAVQSMCQS